MVLWRKAQRANKEDDMLNFDSKKMMLINEKGKPLILEVNGVSTSLGYGIAKFYLPIVFNPTATAPYVVPVPSKISFDINVPSTGTLYRQPGLDSSSSNQTSLGTLQSGDNHITVDFSTNPTRSVFYYEGNLYSMAANTAYKVTITNIVLGS